MLPISLSSPSSSAVRPFSLNSNTYFLSLNPHRSRQLHLTPNTSYLAGNNPFRTSIDRKEVMYRNCRPRGFGPVCYSAGPITPRNLQWISTVASSILLLVRGTAIQKSFLVPLFALQAPTSVVSWIKGEYGIWTAFLALLFRLFFYIPGELELPFLALVMVILAPYQVMDTRGRQEGVILSLAIAGYLGFQHFSRAGSLRKAFDQGSVIATLAIICIVAVPCLLLI